MTAPTVAAVKTSARAPVRGTQSFVGVMAEVWKRPALTALEVLWRWSFSVPAIAFAVWRWRAPAQPAIHFIAENGWSSFAPGSLGVLAADLKNLLDALRPDAWILCLACAAWIMTSAWGSGLVLRYMDRSQSRNFAALLVLSALRVVSLVIVFGVWLSGLCWAVNRMIFEPEALHQELPLVPFAALLIVGTLTMFVAWMACSYVFQLAPVYSVERGIGPWASLCQALRRGALRSKVMEISLVLGIVKIALLVLALVFSSCPLPFSSVATESFLQWWNAGVAIGYLLASDFFHVVRAAACLRLWQVYKNGGLPQTSS